MNKIIASAASIDPYKEFEMKSPFFPTNRVHFLPTKVGKEHTFTMKLTNAFDHTLKMDITCDNEQFKISHNSVTLKAGERKSFSVTFAPKKTGTFSGIVIFTYAHDNTKRFFTVVGKGVK